MRTGLLTLALAACGGGSYDSVEALKNAVVKDANQECPEFMQVDPSGYSAGHGSCKDSSFPDSGFCLDIFKSNDDRDKDIASLKDLPIAWCVAYGDGWAVTFTGTPEDPNCKVVADKMNAEVKRAGS